MGSETVTTPLVDELRRVLRQAVVFESAYGVSLLKAASHSDLDVQVPALQKIDEMGRQLPDLIAADTRFPGTKVLMIHSASNGFVGFYPRFFAVSMILRLLRTGDAEGTIAWLQRILATVDASGWSISLLWYVAVDAPIPLTDDVTIVPVQSIPESVHKRWIAAMPLDVMRSPIGMMDLHPPAAALIKPITLDRFFYSPSDQDEAVVVGEQRSLLYEIGMALTAIGPRPVIPVANWTTRDDPDLEDATMGRRSVTTSS